MGMFWGLIINMNTICVLISTYKNIFDLCLCLELFMRNKNARKTTVDCCHLPQAV